MFRKYLLKRFYVRKVLYSEGPMFRRFYVQKVLYSEGPMFRRSYIQIYSEGPIFRKFFVLKGLAQAKILKKSVILFWLLNMTILKSDVNP